MARQPRLDAFGALHHVLGRVKREWQDTGTILGYFGRGWRGIGKYEQFVREGILLGRRPELVGGGLIRSLGGWSQVLSLRRKGVKVASDGRILGREEFIKRLMLDAYVPQSLFSINDLLFSLLFPNIITS